MLTAAKKKKQKKKKKKKKNKKKKKTKKKKEKTAIPLHSPPFPYFLSPIMNRFSNTVSSVYVLYSCSYTVS